MAKEEVDISMWRRVYELRDKRSGLWKENEIQQICKEDSAEAILDVDVATSYLQRQTYLLGK